MPPPPEAEHISQVGETSPGWFSAYGTAVRAGRDFDDRDTLDVAAGDARQRIVRHADSRPIRIRSANRWP